MALLDSNDCAFSFDGDFVIGNDSDLGDTSSDGLLSLENQVRDLVKAEFGDWESDPAFACDLSDFVGEANTRETGKKIADRIRSKIVSIGLVPDKDLKIRVVPVHVNQVAVLIKIAANSTPNNRLKFGEAVVVSFLYDTMERGIYFNLPDTTNKEKDF